MDAAPPGTQQPILDVISPLRRYVRAHVSLLQDAEDVVQETLARVMAVQSRLAPEATLAYSLVVARHVIADHARSDARQRANAHRYIDLSEPVRPDDVLVRAEEKDALNLALAAIAPQQRQLLLAHVLDGESLTTLASERDQPSGSLAAQLARTRARLRVDYVLALRHQTLPSPRCRPVLLALSAGDTRRQGALRAGHHLLTCETCSDVSDPLLARRTALAALLPWLGLGPLLGLLRRLWRSSPQQVAAGSATITAATALTVFTVLHSSPPPAPAPAPTPVSASAPAQPLIDLADGTSLLPVPQDLSGRATDQVRAQRVPVLAVSADEGFWVGQPGQGRLWVQVTHLKGESPFRIRAGERVDFTGTIARHGSQFASEVGVTPAEGGALLTSQGAHLAVHETDLHRAR